MTILTRRSTLLGGTALGVAGLIGRASAQTSEITIGITISVTGPAAALGVPIRNMVELLSPEIGGLKVKAIVLDDAGDPTAATTNARRFVAEDKADVLMGSSTTPPGIAVSNVAFEANVPHFSFAPIPIQPGREKWSVVMPQPVALMAKGLFDHMKRTNVKTVGMIGFSDSWGDLWLREFKAQAEPAGIRLTADERYARADTSVAGQALKLVSTRPDAVLVAASGTGAALPQIALRERGFTGPIYQTHGAVTRDFIRIAGRAAEGVIMASGPVIAPELLPATAQVKAPGLAYVNAYEGKYGKDTRTQFGAHIFDAWEVLKRTVPVALKTAKPGTQEFREAIRQAMLTERDIIASQGVFNFTATDRYGVDDRARVLITVKDGNWALVPGSAS
ncbi:branched-chain amino acid ABC transporter substrate-binding protein [Phreatobacter aquaticus]|uniref:Branched-chain amino acid ABC transporter substrate-binding protein n=1 Tax=Phreatobacter aquaticus TaxID=2570229 RepID=A0A4D7QIG7_9HYPH|nr:ABC transporter substrate-binding protein [Phreatobacter aquaticus]QCK85549.1 branched-chain amino acid ABC transporter substrate-binding protein [Phreatobacter aquaticus]